jgi:hypothetical protein
MPTQANQPLPAGTVLRNYRIDRVLAVGGFSFVYVAYDEKNAAVAIKEYLPSTVPIRVNGSVSLKEEDRAKFRAGLKCFFEEAGAIAHLEHPNIVRVLDFFRANDTVYLVMRYEQGRSLADHHDFTVSLSVPNDAFWSIENPFHHTMWGEGAFEELRRLLPADHVVARQFALQGSLAQGDGEDSSRRAVELDAGAEQGSVVSPYYDAMLGKVIALARLDLPYTEPGTSVEVGQLDGLQKRLRATVTTYPHFDPKKERVRGAYRDASTSPPAGAAAPASG